MVANPRPSLIRPERPGDRRKRLRDLAIFLTTMLVVSAVLAGVVSLLARGRFRLVPDLPMPTQGCQVSVDGFTTLLTHEQAYNATIIVGEALRRGLPARAASIALVTAYQESNLRNLDYGDRDSLGLFQQRPSQGWGTSEQIMDPWYASGRFYDELVKVPNWQTDVINDVAQAVQRSGHPDAYGKHEQKGRAWASALTGFSPASVTCLDRTDPVGSAGELTSFFKRIYGAAITMETTGDRLDVTANNPTTAWALAQLGVLRSRPAGVISVQAQDKQLTIVGNRYGSWQPPATPSTPAQLVGANTVRFQLRG